MTARGRMLPREESGCRGTEVGTGEGVNGNVHWWDRWSSVSKYQSSKGMRRREDQTRLLNSGHRLHTQDLRPSSCREASGIFIYSVLAGVAGNRDLGV